MGRPREHDESTRTALLAAAENLLGRGEALTVRSVADATATTTRAVYSVFGSMDGLHRALLARAFQDLCVRVEAVPITKDPRADLVRAGLDGFRQFTLYHPNLFRISFERLVPGLASGVDIAEATAAIRALAAHVGRCADAGLLGGRSIGDVTWQFHSFCQGLASVEMHGWLPGDPEQQWRDALAAYVAGLAHIPVKRSRSGSGRSGVSR